MTFVIFAPAKDSPSTFSRECEVEQVPSVGEFVSFDDPTADDGPYFRVTSVRWAVLPQGGAEAIVIMEPAPELDDE
ncbi:hypothetical protein CH305_18585 [Rhodococcus sp. 15-649-2-2]|uniref:hypothetical protein n=1 Tax=Rhodococcus sp. 15-649-2-2 TaxID=2023140 RepID=UPI000B9B0082|nr:hypothetical protein [Rhodococcus sp. 15-649-2-2]OZE77244.1 hypothetical protein CH305_18585 [Rhodococcus sp. 15-649-2-2]